MAAVGDPDRSTAPPEAASSSATSSPRGRRSLHRALGGGAVADVLLWRRRSMAAIAAVVATMYWYLFERAGYTFLSLIANALLLLVTILFFWAKSASLLNRPLPPIPNLEISEETVGRAAERAHVLISRVMAVARDIAIERDRKVFFEVILVLWVVAYIGSFFNFLTLVYIGFLLCLTVPAFYEKYQDHVDEHLGLVHGLVLSQYGNIVGNAGNQSKKEKKIQ